MVGIQFYLRKPIDITPGHVTFVDAPWALTSLTQAQFWTERDFPADYGDGDAVDCLSVDVSDWDTPGILYGKTAKDAAQAEVKREVWAQIKAHLEDTRRRFPARRHPPLRVHRSRPPLAPQEGPQHQRDAAAGQHRRDRGRSGPTARTAISNLFLAGDYVQNDIDLATMEGANETGRAAVAALLEESGSTATPPQMYRLYDPPEFEAVKAVDRELYRQGLPNALDVA